MAQKLGPHRQGLNALLLLLLLLPLPLLLPSPPLPPPPPPPHPPLALQPRGPARLNAPPRTRGSAAARSTVKTLGTLSGQCCERC